MSPRLASTRTSSPAARAAATTRSSAAQPGAPRRSKHATCGLAATQAGPAAAMSAEHCATTISAARSGGGPADAPTAASASGQTRAGSGSRPSTTGDRRAATAAARRSRKAFTRRAVLVKRAPAETGARARFLLAVELLLEPRRRRELGGLARGDLDLLAGRGVHALAGGAVGDAELAEAGDSDLTTGLELGSDDLEDGLDRLLGLTAVHA